MDQHDLILKLKDLAIELGHTPTLQQFCKHVAISKHLVARLWGNYTVFVQAAGLEPNTGGEKRRINNSIFEKDVEQHLDSFSPTAKIPHLDIKYTPTVILGDTHFPFIQSQKLKKSLELISIIKPKRVIQIGDLYDMLSHAKFPRSMNIYTPKDEMSLARKGAEEMWKEIRKLVPGAELHGILGNHDARPMKRVLEQYPEAELFLDFEKWFKFDGVQNHMDLRQELILDGIAYIHGYKSRLGEHMEFMRRPVVCGHSHRAGIAYKNYGDDILFEMNVGYLGDPESKALSYTAQKHTHWTHAVGVINEFGPQVVLL